MAGLVQFWTDNAVVLSITAFVVGAGLSAAVAGWFRRDREPESGARLFYVVCVLCTGISANTSWRFFGGVLHIENIIERAAMFAVLETALIACGYAMRANVRRTTRARRSGRGAASGPRPQPGASRMVAWALAGLASYMAIAESGFWEGIARVALGPVLGIIALHLALGIEIRHSHGETTGTAARVAAELRERALSWLGLGNEQRDALSRTRDRAARRAARLALARRGFRRRPRLQAALRASNVAHDPNARQRLLDELAVLRHADELADLDQPSPWITTGDGETLPVHNGHRPINRPAPSVDMTTVGKPVASADTAFLGDRTPDKVTDTETTDLMPVVSADMLTEDTTLFGESGPDTAVASNRVAEVAGPTTPAPHQELPATTNGHGRASPPLAVDEDSGESDDPDETVDDLDNQAVLIGDERIRHLVELLHEGRELTGRQVGTMFDCSPRTGQRLINRAEQVLSAQRHHLATVGEQ